MNKNLKNILLAGISFLISCTPVKQDSYKNPSSLEEMLAPYTITDKVFKRKYEPQVDSHCTRSKKPEVYAIPQDDRTPTLMALFSYTCDPIKKTNKRYVREYESGNILHGNYTLEGDSVHLIGFLEPEEYPYFKKYILNTGKSFFIFDIDRDGNADFILYGDSPIHPLPKNLDRKETTLRQP